MRICFLLLSTCIVAAASFAATSESLGGLKRPETVQSPAANDLVLTTTLGDLLASVPAVRAKAPSFYEAIPASLDRAVRLIGEENYTSAGEEMLRALETTTTGPERTRVLMWFGLSRGQEAMDSRSWEAGTSSSQFLRAAIDADPSVLEAPDVARILAEMVANGWSEKDPIKEAAEWQQRAERTRRAIDFYYAGVIWRALAQKAWFYKDTTEEDRRYLDLFAKAVACDPSRYESWTAYLPALAPNRLHDLMSTESAKMYAHFSGLRRPLLGDLGPAALFLSSQSGRTVREDEEFLRRLIADHPSEPFAHFELAKMAIETTPSVAVARFEDFLSQVDSGKIKLQPRESGYRVSAMYKLAFLYQHERGIQAALDMYRRVAAVSPRYAETNNNIAALCGQMAEEQTTGVARIRLLEEGLAAAKEQEKYDYQGHARAKASEFRGRLRRLLLDEKRQERD